MTTYSSEVDFVWSPDPRPQYQLHLPTPVQEPPVLGDSSVNWPLPLHLPSLISSAGPRWLVILHSLTLPLALTSYLLQLHNPHLPIGSQSWTGLGRGTRVNESHTCCPWCRMVKKMKHLAVWRSASHFSFPGFSVFISGEKKKKWLDQIDAKVP